MDLVDLDGNTPTPTAGVCNVISCAPEANNTGYGGSTIEPSYSSRLNAGVCNAVGIGAQKPMDTNSNALIDEVYAQVLEEGSCDEMSEKGDMVADGTFAATPKYGALISQDAIKIFSEKFKEVSMKIQEMIQEMINKYLNSQLVENQEVPQMAGEDNLGYLSAQSESHNNPSEISSGNGDAGGKSYGAFQFAARYKVPSKFVKWLEQKNPDMYETLNDAYEEDGNVYGEKFDNAWKEIGENQKDEFLELQYLYTREHYYDNAVDNIRKETGFDFDEQGYTLKNVLWSRIVQHGNTNVVKNALNNIDLETATDAEIIRAIYEESGRVVEEAPDGDSIPMTGPEAEKYGLDGKYMSYFSHNDSNSQVGVWIRLSENKYHEDRPDSEVDKALDMLETYG